MPDLALSRRLTIDYREDDGAAARALSLVALILRHPLRCLVDLSSGHETPLLALAPAVRRLERDAGARVQPLGGADTHLVARRVARLAGRSVDPPAGERHHL
jgi:hypothetical protein